MSEHIIWNEIGTLHFNAGAYTQASKAYHQYEAHPEWQKNLLKHYKFPYNEIYLKE